MADWEAFRKKLRHYRRAVDKGQDELAAALNLNAAFFSHKLNQVRNATLNQREVKLIIRTLITWEALNRYEEVQELLELSDCPDFSREEWQTPPLNRLTSREPIPNQRAIQPQESWGEAPKLTAFYGRKTELATLENWLVREQAGLVLLLGMGGIGKTSLSLKLAHKVKMNFEFVIWRSLQNAPKLTALLTDCLKFSSNQKVADLPGNPADLIALFIEQLRNKRGLLVLDNLETILQPQSNGDYRDGYADYGNFFQQIGRVNHQSSLILTSREKPQELTRLENSTSGVKTLSLTGIEHIAARQILNDVSLKADEAIISQLVNYYAGNPLALKLIAGTIKELFGGNISEFLAEGEIVFGSVRELLAEQFERISSLEQNILYWLAIEREAVSLATLQANFVPALPKSELLEALEQLKRRSLVERIGNSAVFGLQSVILDYVTEHLLETLSAQIVKNKVGWLAKVVLVKASAKEYLREGQKHLILKPLLERLKRGGLDDKIIESQLLNLVELLRFKGRLEQGYAGTNLLNLLYLLKGNLNNLNFSKLNIWQANLVGLELKNTDFSEANFDQTGFNQLFGSIFSVAVRHDYLATGDIQGEIKVWSVQTGTNLLNLSGHNRWIWSLAFSPDGEWLASASDEATLKIWEVKTGNCRHTLRGHGSGVWSVAFYPNGALLLSGSDDKTLRWWNIVTGECQEIISGHSAGIMTVAISPDGKRFTAGSKDGTLYLREIGEKSYLKIIKAHIESVMGLAFSPDGKIVASGGEDRLVCLWDSFTGELVQTLEGHTDGLLSVRFSSDGQMLASSSQDRTIKLWQVADGKCLHTLEGHTDWVAGVGFNADGTTLVSGSHDSSLKWWDIPTGYCLRTLNSYNRWVVALAFNRRGDKLVSGSADHIVRLWDLATQNHTSIKGHNGKVWAVAFDIQGNYFASGGEDWIIKIWSAAKGELFKELSGHTGRIRSLSFSPTGKTVASASEDWTVRLWDLETGECTKILRGHTGRVRAIAFSSDGKTIASGGNDNIIRLWESASGESLGQLGGHSGWIRTLAFSPDGTNLISGSDDKTVKLWNVGKSRLEKTLEGHTGRVRSAVFSLDGKLIATGGDDLIINIWETASGELIKTLSGHTGRIWSLAFNHLLASGSEDGTIKLWDIQAGNCLATLENPKSYTGMKLKKVSGLNKTILASLTELGAVENGID
jgi:WD40 repeat protein